MVNERFTRWVQASRGLEQLEVFMILTLQGLGRLDCHLIAEDLRFLHLAEETRSTIHESLATTDRFTLSYLWVLGAYELVRTLDQRCRQDQGLIGAELVQRVRRLKHTMERLRMPLAKMEPAKRYPEDSRIAVPCLDSTAGTAWGLGPATIISRRELSDALLQLAEDICTHFASRA